MNDTRDGRPPAAPAPPEPAGGAAAAPRPRKRDLPRAVRRAAARARRGAAGVTLFVACAPGLEPLLADEVRAAALGSPRVLPGGVELEADVRAMVRANLELGLAIGVRARVGRFRATALAELVRRTAELPWAPWIPPGAAVRVRAVSARSRLFHTGAIAERVAEGLGAGRVVGDAEGGAGPLVHARLVEDVVELSVETSGEPLHRRGWRLESGKAPLREDLARALVVASGWDRRSPLVDPMAGAGTVAIEAALLAADVAPGLGRGFAFEAFPAVDARLVEALREAAAARRRPGDAPVLARDRDAGAVASLTRNAARAGVEVEVSQAPLSAPWPQAIAASAHGALVTNPPWGRRVGGEADLRPLYQRLAALVAALPPAWRVGLAAHDAALVRRAKLDLAQVLLTDAGGTKVRFFARR